MDPTDQENSLQDIRTAGTGIIWKERDDEWSSTLQDAAPHSKMQVSPRSPSCKEINPKELEPKDGGAPENSEQA